ncbi:MAG TPA: pyrroline-5-carboxylate reductase [Candidatus Angelobacter sp.]|nr:pyrroline-5-carboxylate reductase [Candidatus Angelobacter sp.]
MSASSTRTATRTAVRDGQGKARSQKQLAVIGCGKMGSILLQAFLDRDLVSRKGGEVVATVQHEDKKLAAALDGIVLGTDNRAAVSGALVVLLCVKPQVLPQVLKEIAPVIAREKDALVISIAASTTVSFIQQQLGKDVAVIRAMPNTPAMVGAAMTALSAGATVKPEQLETAKRLFEAVGRVVIVDEKHMDAITALSASGPAFVFVILESLAEAGVKVGLPREMATTLAAQTLFGAAKLALETGHHPALLKDAVTTPAGCTIEGLMELERGGLRVTLMNAVITTTKRARELMTS